MDEYWEPGQPLEGPERWYPVLGYEGIYEVSTEGRIRRIAGGPGTRIKDGKPRIVQTHPNSKGYWICNLWKDSKRETIKVHKVVARAFLGDPPEDIAGEFEIHHKRQKNGVPDPEGVPDKNDNRACMLEYQSAYDNMMEMQARYYKTGRWKG
jgi:hypothetical protein